MNETFLHLGGDLSAARLTFRSITGSRGVGAGQLHLTVEATSRKPSADGNPLWINGTVSVGNLGVASGYLGQLRTEIQPLVLPERGGSRTVRFDCGLGHNQILAIEEHRTGPVLLCFDFAGYWLIDGDPQSFWGSQFEHEVAQSDWITLLEQFGYQRTLLLEFPAPDFQGNAGQVQARQFFEASRKHYLEHEWRLTVESLRQCLAALVGREADDEDGEVEVQRAVKDLRRESTARGVGYAERREPVRLALKFLCDIGAHPEVAETTKRDAYSALLMVAGLLSNYSG